MKATSAVLFSLAVSSFCSLSANAQSTVYYHGSVLTHSAKSIGGQTYVPLADVAKALSCRVSSTGGALSLVSATAASSTAGGANQVTGTTGNVGDWFFNGKWRFKVIKVDRPDTYTWQYYDTAGSDSPSSPDDQLVVFYCQIKNGEQRADEPILTVHGLDNQMTALTDDQGNSYSPIDFDLRGGALVPGGAKSFNVVFSVPKTAKISQLIFTLYSYTDTKATNVRVNVPAQ